MGQTSNDASKERREAEILHAALTLFAEKGFHVTRMDDIAAAAGVSKGTLYLYFDNKKALFRGLITHFARHQLDEVAEVFQQAKDLATLLPIVKNIMLMVLTESDLPRLLRVLLRESAQFPDLLQFYREEVIERNLALWTAQFAGIPHQNELANLMASPIALTLLWQEFFFIDQPLSKEKIACLIETQFAMVQAYIDKYAL